MSRRLVASAWLAIGLLAPGVSAYAQNARPGWIGISYEVRALRGGEGARLVITDVRRGSPAESAGIRSGDRLIAIEDLTSADELMNVSRRLNLRAGQVVQMRLERDGRPLDLRVRAAERPFELYTDAAASLSYQADSMVETMFRAMDSLRVHLLEASDRPVSRVSRSTPGASSIDGLAPAGREAVSAPFEFFVFRGEQYDSLVQAMDELNEEMEDLRQRETERLRELRRSRRGQRSEEQDRQLAALREAFEELTRRSGALRAAMAEAARASAGWEYLLPGIPEPSPEPPEATAEPFRPLTPYLLGSNRVAGAQVIDLQPELGAYFGVDRGVLVVDVSPGTPAAIAGMLPGDVVTRLDQVGVGTVEDLRFGVAQAGDTLPVTLIRKGASVQVLLRRR